MVATRRADTAAPAAEVLATAKVLGAAVDVVVEAGAVESAVDGAVGPAVVAARVRVPALLPLPKLSNISARSRARGGPKNGL